MKRKTFSFENGTTTGILRNLSESPHYWQLFSYHATKSELYHPAHYAFNFTTNQYWIADANDVPNNLSFCFKDFSIKATGYELKSSNSNDPHAAKASKWGFSGSNDGQNWQFYTDTNYSMKGGEILFVSWSPEIPFRCFQLTTIEATYTDFQNRFDLICIDVYGQILLDLHSCLQKLNQISLRFFIVNLIFNS